VANSACKWKRFTNSEPSLIGKFAWIFILLSASELQIRERLLKLLGWCHVFLLRVGRVLCEDGNCNLERVYFQLFIIFISFQKIKNYDDLKSKKLKSLFS
jgi:hypothetical protein